MHCNSLSKVWQDIVNLGQNFGVQCNIFYNSFKWRVGSGELINFWKSNWLGTNPLCKVFPCLFNLSGSKDFSVRDLYDTQNGDIRWQVPWKRPLRGRAATEEVELLNLLAGIQINPSNIDKRIWIHGGNSEFSSAEAYSILQPHDKILDQILCNRLWNKLTPAKVSIFGWRLLLQCLPTKDELLTRDCLDSSQLLCPFCSEEDETLNHLFLSCKKSSSIWRKCLNWWDNPLVLPQSVLDLIHCFCYGIKKIVHN